MKIAYPDKLTYIDEIMKSEKKQKKPAPGQYNVMKTQKEIESDKKKMAQKKIPVQDRISYLDNIQFESTQTPGVGNYNPRVCLSLLSNESRPKAVKSRQNLKTGAKSMNYKKRKSLRKVRLCELTTLSPLTILSLRP